MLAAEPVPGQLPTAQDLDEDDGESFREVAAGMGNLNLQGTRFLLASTLDDW